jgi:hypothetical protein
MELSCFSEILRFYLKANHEKKWTNLKKNRKKVNLSTYAPTFDAHYYNYGQS